MLVKHFLEKKNKTDLIFYVLLSIFIIFTLFLAIKLRMGLSPDSSYHLEVSQAYSTTWTIPQNTPDTYQWRDITRIPYLYFWINARILNINNGLLNEITLLRIVNVFYSTLTVIFTYLLSKEIFKKDIFKVLPTFLLTNTLMFTFLSSSINYDNLANLFSVLGIYFFVKYLKSKVDIKYILLMLIYLALGTFAKYTILPLAFILVILTAVDIYIRRKDLKFGDIKKYWYLLIPLFIALFFNFQVYGINIIRYGSLDVQCDKILTHEQCMQNGVYYRDNTYYSPIEIDGVGRMFDLVLSGERIDFIRYFGYWIWNITGKIFSIMGDTSLYMPEYFKIPYLLFLLLAIILSIIYRKKWSRVEKYLLVTTLFYISVLFFIQNYMTYLKFDHFYLALQGRYIFPVIVPMYIIYSRAISFVKNKKVLYLILIPLCILFLYGCIPFFLLNVPSSWFR
jgi:hypothetical protein